MVKITFSNILFEQGIEFSNTGNGKISIEVKGHSLSGEKGSSIICSAISIISQTMVAGISRITEIAQDYIQRDGYLITEIDISPLDDEKKHDLKIILNIFCIGLFEILKTYPDSINIDFNSK